MTEPRAPRKLKLVIGRAERIDFPDANVFGVPAKIDTGAYRTSVWASDIHEKDGSLRFKLLGPGSKWYSGKEYQADTYEIVEVENSFGAKENRYSIFMRIKIGAKTVKSNVTLSDRSTKIYPVLIGRKMLKGRYIVDVAEGDPIDDEEATEL